MNTLLGNSAQMDKSRCFRVSFQGKGRDDSPMYGSDRNNYSLDRLKLPEPRKVMEASGEAEENDDLGLLSGGGEGDPEAEANDAVAMAGTDQKKARRYFSEKKSHTDCSCALICCPPVPWGQVFGLKKSMDPPLPRNVYLLPSLVPSFLSFFFALSRESRSLNQHYLNSSTLLWSNFMITIFASIFVLLLFAVSQIGFSC